jgi:hypothetical protein
MKHRVILLHVQAPAKPATGEPCNGCGWCCAAEPCPLGTLLSRRRRGACKALLWSQDEQCYRCGAVSDPRQFVNWLPATWVRHAALRWISAAQGCDADITAVDVIREWTS